MSQEVVRVVWKTIDRSASEEHRGRDARRVTVEAPAAILRATLLHR